MWHIPNNLHSPTGSILRDTCAHCKKLHHQINQLVERAVSTSDEKKMSRTSVSSNYPLKYLSAPSKNSRITKITTERKSLSIKLSTVTFDCCLKDKQHTELLHLITAIEKHNGSKIIEDLCAEGDRILGESNVLRDVWKQDVLDRLEYERDQHKSGKYQRTDYCN